MSESLVRRFLNFLERFLDWFFNTETLPQGKVWPENYFSEENQFFEPEENSFVVRNRMQVKLHKTRPINVSSEAASKIFAYTKAVDTEVGGLLVVEEERGITTVTDALLFNQRASMGGMHLNPKTLAKQLNKIALEEPEKLEKIKGWWHSHCNMGVYWSYIDNACFSNFLQVCQATYGIVVNKQGKAKARLDVRTGVGIVSVGNADFELGEILPRPECVAEAKKKVRNGFFDFWPVNVIFKKEETVPLEQSKKGIPVVAKQGQ